MCSLMETINSSPQILGRSPSSSHRLSSYSTSPNPTQRRDSSQHRVSQATYNSSTPEMTAGEFSDSEASMSSPSKGYRDSREWPQFATPYKLVEPPDDQESQVKRARFTPELQIPELPELSPTSSDHTFPDSSIGTSIVLPPPAIPEFSFQSSAPLKDFDNVTKAMTTSEETIHVVRAKTTQEDRATWEKKLFTNSAVLCDL